MEIGQDLVLCAGTFADPEPAVGGPDFRFTRLFFTAGGCCFNRHDFTDGKSGGFRNAGRVYPGGQKAGGHYSRDQTGYRNQRFLHWNFLSYRMFELQSALRQPRRADVMDGEKPDNNV
jgi:hypothetical protein